MAGVDLQTLFKASHALPAVPEVAARLIATFEDDDIDFNRIAADVDRDPVLVAKVLQRAGAVRAIELDINEDWTSFISYRRPGGREPSNLLPEMYRSPERYLEPDERDFFAVYLKPGQPW